MKKILLFCIVAALLFAGCTPFSEVVPETPQDVIEIGMYVLTGGVNPESMVIGADGTPSPLRAPTGLAGEICRQVDYEVVSVTENGDTATVVMNITTPDAVSLLYTALEGMKNYDETAFLAKMEELLTNSPPTKTFTVNMEMKKLDGVWCMDINAEFSNAITGGLMAEYNELQQAILDKMQEGGED